MIGGFGKTSANTKVSRTIWLNEAQVELAILIMKDVVIVFILSLCQYNIECIGWSEGCCLSNGKLWNIIALI